jgi:hypothetical protein
VGGYGGISGCQVEVEEPSGDGGGDGGDGCMMTVAGGRRERDVSSWHGPERLIAYLFRDNEAQFRRMSISGRS